MTAHCIENPPVVRGWCPSAWRPMRSSDGYIFRARPAFGRLSPAQALGLADLCEKFGDGGVELSGRANAQLRGVSENNIEILRNALVALKLTAPEEAVRPALLIEPFWRENDDSFILERILRENLQKLPKTPDKFGIAIDLGDRPRLRAVPADIRFERDAAGAWICRPDGAQTGAPVALETAVAVLSQLIQWFLDSGGAPDGRGRMAAHLSRGAVIPEIFRQNFFARNCDFVPKPGAAHGGILVGFAFGAMTAAQLRALAALGGLRLTPWRMVFIEDFGSMEIIADHMEGVILDPNDPLLRVAACAGKTHCWQAFSSTRDIAQALAPYIPLGAFLHVSGCSKGCAHPTPAPITLTATRENFDLVRMGRADGSPCVRNLEPENLLSRPEKFVEIVNALGL